LPALGDVPEDQHTSSDLPLGVADGGSAVVNGSLRTVFGDKEGVVGQADDQAFA
jgi:hypothetical protein